MPVLPREGVPVEVFTGLWLPTGRLEGVLKGLLRVGSWLPCQALCQNPSEKHFLALISSTTVTHLVCVSEAETVVAARPFSVSA